MAKSRVDVWFIHVFDPLQAHLVRHPCFLLETHDDIATRLDLIVARLFLLLRLSASSAQQNHQTRLQCGDAAAVEQICSVASRLSLCSLCMPVPGTDATPFSAYVCVE